MKLKFSFLKKNLITLKKTNKNPIKPNSPKNSTKSEWTWFANKFDEFKNLSWNKISKDPAL